MIGHLSVILIYGGIEWADLHASPTYFLGSKWPDSEYARVSIGNVQGGAETVVDALLKVLGPKGTLVVPTFTYPGDYPPSRDPNWIFDPDRTPSAMGAITNAARTRPQAQRSFHLWHSVAAIGPLANTITTIGGSSAWNSNCPMAWICKNDGQFLLLGVPYGNLTAIHIWEVALAVAYRREYDVKRRMRCSDGSLAPLISRVHDRTESHPGSVCMLPC